MMSLDNRGTIALHVEAADGFTKVGRLKRVWGAQELVFFPV
jgi:hypothetical protein